MIETLENVDEFRFRTRACWIRNTSYWLANPLRHVTDVGGYIIKRIVQSSKHINSSKPTIVDMGFGSAWVLRQLREAGFNCNYVGIDWNAEFVSSAQKEFKSDKSVFFHLADIEEPIHLDLAADVVLYSFSFFELSNLEQPMLNAKKLLSANGRLLISTIDSTYLILAVSSSWPEFLSNLSLYEKLPGTKYAFQPIDLGDGLSSHLEYPSVLYSRMDYLLEAKRAGFTLINYNEHIFTSKKIPKIYFHMEFEKRESDAVCSE